MESHVKTLVRMLSELAGWNTSPDSDIQLQTFAFDLFLFDIVPSYQSYTFVTQSQSNLSAHIEPVTVEFGLLLYQNALKYGLIDRYNNSVDPTDHLDIAEQLRRQLLIEQMVQEFLGSYTNVYLTRQQSLEIIYEGLGILE